MVYDTEKKFLQQALLGIPTENLVYKLQALRGKIEDYTRCDLNYIVKHATAQSTQSTVASERHPAPELKIGKLKDITTLEELIRQPENKLDGIRIRASGKTRIKGPCGRQQHTQDKMGETKELHGHRIGVFRIRFRTTREA